MILLPQSQQEYADVILWIRHHRNVRNEGWPPGSGGEAYERTFVRSWMRSQAGVIGDKYGSNIVFSRGIWHLPYAAYIGGRINDLQKTKAA